MGTNGPIYREVQRPGQWWIWLTVVAVGGLGWWLFVQQIILGQPLGNNPMSDWGAWLTWLLAGLGLPALLLSMRLVVEVRQGELLVNYRPLTRRVIALADVQEATVRTYSPVKEYGGWGIKGWSRRNITYNVRGDRGVQLVLVDGRKILIGSQRPEELARALEMGRNAI